MNAQTLRYWIPTALFALAMTGSGVMNLLRPDEIVASMEHLSFPTWFPVWLGSWKLIGVAVLLAPGLARFKEWATAGFTISLTSATVAHLGAGDPIGEAIPPLVMLGIGLASWAFRPASRRLPDGSTNASPASATA